MKECFCIGPQNGQPLCRCRMRNVQVKDGRYVEMIDHGPAPANAPDDYSWVRVTVNGQRIEDWLRSSPPRTQTRIPSDFKAPVAPWWRSQWEEGV